MKKLITIILAMALILPTAAPAEDKDPIIGAWYIMLDYRDIPETPESAGKNYMIYIMIFDDSGSITGITAEDIQNSGMVAQGAAIGTWSKTDDGYTVNMIGVGSNRAEFSDDRLLVQMVQNVWYSMQRLNMGSWYNEIVIRQ